MGDQLRRVVKELTESRVPGLCVAVAREGAVTLVQPAGVASVIDREPTTPDTAYLWFSMTKIATATAAVRLVDSGALGLDDPVSKYVPAGRPGPGQATIDGGPPPLDLGTGRLGAPGGTRSAVAKWRSAQAVLQWS